MKLAVVIPAYNEAETISEVVFQCLEYADLVIVVDDGSVDGTADRLQGTQTIILRNVRNQGKAASLKRGFRYALEQDADAIITLDGDGQHSPGEVPGLVATAKQYPDTIIIAARQKNRSVSPVIRLFANDFADFWISWAAGYPVIDSQSGFRLYPSILFTKIDKIFDLGQGFVFESEILIEASRRRIYSFSVAVDTICHKGARPSHYRPFRDTARIVRMVASKLLLKGLYPQGLLRALQVLPDPRGT